MTTPELPEPAVRITVELAMVKGGVTKPAPFYSADQMHDLASRLASLQTDCDGLVRQNEALHRVCRQKEESIAAAERERDALAEALALLADVYDAMGAPRGPARIVADAALSSHQGQARED